jgi:branched-chain amino acid transport system substrate-binding protein
MKTAVEQTPRHSRPALNASILASMVVVSLFLTACSARVGDQTSTSATGAGNNPLTKNCQNYTPESGITKNSIAIGTSLPITGPLAIPGTFHYGLEAYIDSVNASGGFQGHKIKLTTLDDGYDPAKTATNVKQLVNGDGVFAIVGLLGTAPVLAVQKDLQANCVPNLLAQTGAPQVATEDQTWTLPQFPSYTLEAQALAQRAINSGAKRVSIISQNDDFGKSYVSALTASLKTAGIAVSEQVTYNTTDPSINTQITQLSSDKADAVLIAALGTKCPQILNGIQQSGWKPLELVANFCTSSSLLGLLKNGAGNNMVATAWYKSPTDPRFKSDPGLATYRAAIQKYAPKADANEDFILDGWLAGQMFVDILKKSKTLDRGSVMAAARDITLHPDTMLDGIQFSTAGGAFAPITKVQLRRYDSATGRLIFINAKTGADVPTGQTSLVSATG